MKYILPLLLLILIAPLGAFAADHASCQFFTTSINAYEFAPWQQWYQESYADTCTRIHYESVFAGIGVPYNFIYAASNADITSAPDTPTHRLSTITNEGTTYHYLFTVMDKEGRFITDKDEAFEALLPKQDILIPVTQTSALAPAQNPIAYDGSEAPTFASDNELVPRVAGAFDQPGSLPAFPNSQPANDLPKNGSAYMANLLTSGINEWFALAISLLLMVLVGEQFRYARQRVRN